MGGPRAGFRGGGLVASPTCSRIFRITLGSSMAAMIFIFPPHLEQVSNQLNNFLDMLVESENWEDFTLRFEDRIESFEVKWHARPLSYSDVKEIIAKEINKNSGEDYSFKIVAKSFSSKFLKDIEHVKKILPYLASTIKISEGREDSVIKKLRTKEWTNEEIAFLIRTEFISMDSEENVLAAITEQLSFKWYLYLANDDLNALVASCFREILQKAKSGLAITKAEFESALSKFDESRATASESFDPVLTIGERTESLNNFLVNIDSFQGLNHKKYLTPLTSFANQHIMFYLVRKLEINEFPVSAFEFFLKKVLLKQSHVHTCFRLLEAKWKAGFLENDFFIQFLSDNFERLNYDYVVHDALGIVLEILNSTPDKSESILEFLKKRIFPKVVGRRLGARRDMDYSYKYSDLPEIINQIGQNIDSVGFIDLLFQYFDFTGDHYHLVVETPAKIYGFVRDYIKKNPKAHVPIILQKLKVQFNAAYGVPYQGYEMLGGSVGFQGSSFSVTDVGLVRYLFQPLFSELFKENDETFFKLLKEMVFKSKAEASVQSPVYLKRAAVQFLFQVLADPATNTERKKLCRKYIVRTLEARKGFPNTSEVIFNYLSVVDLKAIGHDFVMELVRQDQVKFEQDRLPTNIFVLHTVLKLIEDGSLIAFEYLLTLVARPEFKRLWLAKELLSLLGNSSILPSHADLRTKIIRSFDLKSYLEASKDSDWISSSFLKNLLDDLWSQMPDEADKLIKDLISDEQPSKAVLDLLGNTLFELFQKHPARLHTIFQKDLTDPKSFQQRYGSSDIFRQNFSRLAEALMEIGQFEDAKQVIGILMNDLDPNTDAVDQYNNHLKVKNGDVSLGISGSRANAAWVIQKFALKNEYEPLIYALDMTTKLADMDGSLSSALGYSERDLYVMAQAMVPLTELAHPYRRRVLEQHSPGKGLEVKDLALSVLRFLKSEFKSGNSKPNAVAEYVVMVFDKIRDLSNDEATEVLDFFELGGFEKAVSLFIFFAIFQQKAYPKSQFNQTPFLERLEKLCSTKNPIRQTLSWQIWRGLDDKTLPVADRPSLERLIPLFLNEYEADVFSHISHIVEIGLRREGQYQQYFDILRKAISIEIAELQKASGHPRISLRKSGELLVKHSISDFFEIVDAVLVISDPKTGKGLYGSNLYSLIERFKTISDVPKENLKKYNEIRTRLTEMGAFIDA